MALPLHRSRVFNLQRAVTRAAPRGLQVSLRQILPALYPDARHSLLMEILIWAGHGGACGFFSFSCEICSRHRRIRQNQRRHMPRGKEGKAVAGKNPAVHHSSYERISKSPFWNLSSKTVALIANGSDAAAQSALKGNAAAVSEAAAPAQTSAPDQTPRGILPGLGTARSSEATDPKAVPVADSPVPPAPDSMDPWKGKQNEAISLVTGKTLPKSKITVGSQAKSMLQEMHEKELIHAAETGERLYLPDKIAWAALQEEGPHYRVYLNFMASQASGERVQTRSYQFLVDDPASCRGEDR